MNPTFINGNTFPGKKIIGEERYRKLYHYTSFDAFVKIWLTKQLKFGEVSSVNDIQEADIRCELKTFQQMPLMHAYHDIRSSFKQVSLTMDYDSYIKGCMSPMMWGLYADKRKGVCIEFDYDKIKFPDGMLKGIVNYNNILDLYAQLPIYAKTEKDIRRFITKQARQFFYTKQNSWKGENEYRIICDNADFLNISNAISAVYLTSFDSSECMLVEKIVGETIPVKYITYTCYKNKAIPILLDTKENRIQIQKARNDPNNALNKLNKQALEEYEALKGSEDKSLLKSSYFI